MTIECTKCDGWGSTGFSACGNYSVKCKLCKGTGELKASEEAAKAVNIVRKHIFERCLNQAPYHLVPAQVIDEIFAEGLLWASDHAGDCWHLPGRGPWETVGANMEEI
jgi:hypothetical protein